MVTFIKKREVNNVKSVIDSAYLKVVVVVSLLLSILSIYPVNKVGATESNNSSPTEEEIVEETLKIIFEEDAVVEDLQGNVLGYDRDVFESSLPDSEEKSEIIKGLDNLELFAENSYNTNDVKSPIPTVAACGWKGKTEKISFIKAENACYKKGIKKHYGYVAIGSAIANLIADKEFKLAAKKIVSLGVRSNIAGVVVTFAAIFYDCGKKMEKKFPGDSNCVKI